MSQSQSYLITVQGIDELSWTSTAYSKLRRKTKLNLYIEVYVDRKQVARTKIAQNNVWGETLTIPQANESSELLIKLKHKSSLLTDPCFGVVEGTIGHLLSLCEGREVTRLKLTHGLKKSMTDAQGAISATIKASDDGQARQNLLRVVEEDIARRHIDHGAALAVPEAFKNVAANVSNNEDLLQSLGIVIEKIQCIAKITLNAVDALAKVHPYADVAWKILSSVHKAYEHQKDTDAAVVALFKQMEALYSFVGDLDSLPGKIKQLEHAIVPILAQTTECALFFREYTGRGFVGRFLDQATSNHNQTIKNLSATLTQLHNDLNSGVQLHTAFMSSYTRDGVDKLLKSDILKVLHPARMNAAERPMCLPGTTQDRQNEIIDWLMNPSDRNQNVLWLRGAAGLGKSTLATTIAEHFRGLQRRGAFLFFDRNSPIESSPSRVISTLAHQLAEHDESVRSAVSAAIERDPQLATTPLITQFKLLLCAPLSAASIRIAGPIIIVIDALDECGDANSRRLLLRLLSSPDFATLPSQFRFLITSRSEPDIEGALHSCEHVKAVDYSKASDRDMMLYIKHEIEEVCRIRQDSEELPVGWPGEKQISRLVQFADGFFIWTATAMKLLNAVEEPVEWLANLMLEDGRVSLNDLYKKALLSVREWKAGKITDIYQRILGLIIVSQVPLTDTAIGDLLGLDQASRKTCRTALRRLSSVIQWSEGQSARTLHKSFPDYLTDENACSSEPWFINVKEHQHALAVACLRVMNDGLHFNMGHLKTSYVPNADIPDLSARVADAIPRSMSYACQFWGQHLCGTIPGEPSIHDLILHFFELKFLYWLEVLSLLGEVSLASRTLVSVIKQCPVAKSSSKVYAFAQDGLKFVGAFAPAMACSAPHIYISCIPFAPRASLIKQQYMDAFQNVLTIEIGMDENWPALQQVINGSTNRISSVVFSPDGQRIASGSWDKTIRIWDVTTGTLIAGPFEGHTNWVNSVVFSPDGQHIVSGSCDNTIRIWDVTTGTLIAGPLKGHTDWVKSVVFSPDGQCVASSSDDKTIRIWDAITGTLIAGPFKGHTGDVNSVVFSPDGQRIASGSDDNTIRIWDATTGVLIAGPFEGHTSGVNSVAFSPDGQYTVSGSDDSTIRIWDAATGTLIAGPFKGHADGINSVVFSPDGHHIASGSDDKTIRICDADTGILIAGPFKGHTDSVSSVVFSLDGQHIVSGSDDSTVRIWDATPGTLAAGPLKGHTKMVWSVVFSPDGQRIASGSRDNTIRIWNATTGALIAGPFEGHTDWVNAVVFSPDGQHIASGSADRTIRIWDSTTGALIAGPLEGHAGSVWSVALSPDGQRIASGSSDKSIRIWDATMGTLITGPLEGHTDDINSMVFSPDGQHIVSGSDDNTIRIWDATTGASIVGPLKGHTHRVWSVALSPDGQRIASGSRDNTIRIWDATMGTLIAGPLKGHTGAVKSVVFSPDGRHIASGLGDKTIRIWDADTGILVVGPLKEHGEPVESVALSPDGKRLVTSSGHNIRVLDISVICDLGKHGTTKASSQECHSDAYTGFGSYSHLENGWMFNSSSDPLFYVPHDRREGLWWPHNTAVISPKSTRLDLTRFVHGENWVRCRT